MLVAMATYLLGSKHLPDRAQVIMPRACVRVLFSPILLSYPVAQGRRGSPLSLREGSALLALCMLTVPYWMVYAQVRPHYILAVVSQRPLSR